MMNAHCEGATGNVLVDALPPRERSKLAFVDVFLSAGQVLCEHDQEVLLAYFPTTCVVSCLYTTRDGTTAETALIGNEGMFDVRLFLSGGRTSNRAVVQIPGRALRISAAALQAGFADGGAFQHLLLRYTEELLAQVSQTAVCNRLHSLEQRLCRWLLLCHDRVGHDNLTITHEQIASMVGGRRESVTVMAGRLQELGAIRYSRGQLSVIDRQVLEQSSCECYEVVTKRTIRPRIWESVLGQDRN
jgi:CRP-like cAMP-binding protein